MLQKYKIIPENLIFISFFIPVVKGLCQFCINFVVYLICKKKHTFARF